MTNEYIQRLRQTEKEIGQFIAPLVLFQLSFYLLPWFCTILLYISLLLITKKEYLFALYVGLSFFNVMNIEHMPFWASLVSSYLSLIVILIRIGKLKKNVPSSFLIAGLLQ